MILTSYKKARMILSLAILHVRHLRDKDKDLLYPLPSCMWWFYTGLPPLPAPAKKRDRVMGPPPPPPRWAVGGGGGGGVFRKKAQF
jgi:hypothetical protein